MNAQKAPARRRVGDYDRQFGPALDEIEGEDLILVDFSVGLRSLTRDGETGERPFTTVEVAKEEGGPTKVYHTWSESIAEKLAGIPKDELPLDVQFKKVRTGAGFEVWDVA